MKTTIPPAAFSTDDRSRRRHDPAGQVECAGCDALGRPRGGVAYQLQARRVTLLFELPDGWAVQECQVLCAACAVANGGSF